MILKARTLTKLFKKACCISVESAISMVNFQGQHIRSVSCYTLLSGFQLPWPPSDCLYVLTPFNDNKQT